MGASATARTGPWPKHHRIYLVLRRQIEEGAFPEGLPNEFRLAAQFAVSRITIRKAMERLEAEERITRHRGRGTFARACRPAAPVQASISGMLENLIAMGLETEVRVVSFAHVAASPTVAEALELEPGVQVQKAVRVRAYRSRPFSHLTSYVPAALVGDAFGVAELSRQPLLVLLERAGVTIDRAEQIITASLAVPYVATLLAIEPGEALLSIKRVVRDRDGRPVEYIEGLYRPDTYAHHMRFERRRDGKAVWTAEEI